MDARALLSGVVPTTASWVLLCLAVPAGAADPVRIALARGTTREQATRAQLERILQDNDLTRYTFTREVVIEEGARRSTGTSGNTTPYRPRRPPSPLGVRVTRPGMAEVKAFRSR